MKLLQSEDRPEAIVCFNDTVAIGAYRAANELGLTIGKDVAITGYDDTKICEQLPVQLTTVKFPKYEVGKAAAELLHKMVLGEATKLHRFLDIRVYAVEKYDHYPNIWPIEKDVDNADGLINNDVRLVLGFRLLLR
jgi:DNA-binding LacI/PurR family transcriptional regulator